MLVLKSTMAPMNNYKNPETTRVDLTVLTDDAFEPRKVFTRTVGQSVLIGRASKIPAQNADPDSALYRNQVLSREHAFLSWRSTGVMLRDNKSTHGTSIRRTQDGVSSVFELTKGIDTPLHHGDIVILGKHITRLEAGSKDMVDYAPLMLQVGLDGGSLRSGYASKLSQSSLSHRAYGLSASEQVASDEDCRDLPPALSKSAGASSIVVIEDSSDSNDSSVKIKSADKSNGLVNAVNARPISPLLFSAPSDPDEANTAKTATITALPVQDTVMESSRDNVEAADVDTYGSGSLTDSHVLTRSDRAKPVVASLDETNDDLQSLPASSFGVLDSPSAVLDHLDTSSDVVSSQAQESADLSVELEEPQSMRNVCDSDVEHNAAFREFDASSEEGSEMEDGSVEEGSEDGGSDAESEQDSDVESEDEELSVCDSDDVEQEEEMSETSSQIFDQSSQADTESRFKKRRRISSSSIEQDLDSDSTNIKKFEDSLMNHDELINFDLSQTVTNDAARDGVSSSSSVPALSDRMSCSESLASDAPSSVHGDAEDKGRPTTLRQVKIVRDAATQVEAPKFTTIAVQTGTRGKDACTQFEHAPVPNPETVELSSKKRSFDAMTATELVAQEQEAVGSVGDSTVAQVLETRPVRKLPLRGLLQLSSVFLAGAVAGIVGIAYLPDIE